MAAGNELSQGQGEDAKKGNRKMLDNNDAHPSAGKHSGWAIRSNRGAISTQTDYTMTEPVALAVFKRGRWCVVAKLTFLNGERILAVAHREQKGVVSTISIPVLVLEYARLQGVTTLYFRRDKTGEMWQMPLSEIEKKAYLGPGAGAEWYIDVKMMKRVAWRKWAFAERIVNLGDFPSKAKENFNYQGSLWEVNIESL